MMETALSAVCQHALMHKLSVSQVLEELLYMIDQGNRAKHVTPEMRKAGTTLFGVFYDPKKRRPSRPHSRPDFYPPLGSKGGS